MAAVAALVDEGIGAAVTDVPVVISQAELLHVPGLQLSEYRNACWFADVWAEHCRPGMHLRAIHYKLVSVGTVTMAPGVRPHIGRGRPAADPVLDAIRLPYENTSFCWHVLQKCALAARYWRLVDARDFEEHRSPEAFVNAVTRETPTPSVELPLRWPDEGFPEPEIVGYDYSDADQPLTIDVWCEKSTMDDVLAPLCTALRVNYQPLTGMFSVTRAVEMLCRLNKPAVVLYVSDLDGAGCTMPTAFADALAHYAPIYAPDVDIRLKQIALTEDQAVRYRLPRNVIDAQEETPYNKRFRAEHPLGPCELDALEAIAPGTLARIVRTAIAPFIDRRISKRLREAHDAATELVTAAWDAQSAEARGGLAQLDAQLAEIQQRLTVALAPHEQAMRDIRATFTEEFAPLEAARDDVRQRVLDETIAVDLPERPQPDVPVPDDDWLYARVTAS